MPRPLSGRRQKPTQDPPEHDRLVERDGLLVYTGPVHLAPGDDPRDFIDREREERARVVAGLAYSDHEDGLDAGDSDEGRSTSDLDLPQPRRAMSTKDRKEPDAKERPVKERNGRPKPSAAPSQQRPPGTVGTMDPEPEESEQ